MIFNRKPYHSIGTGFSPFTRKQIVESGFSQNLLMIFVRKKIILKVEDHAPHGKVQDLNAVFQRNALDPEAVS